MKLTDISLPDISCFLYQLDCIIKLNKISMSKDSKWYKSWWGILILILFWPVSLSYFVWNQKFSVRIKAGIIIAIWLVFVYTVSLTRSSTSSINEQDSPVNNSQLAATTGTAHTKVENPTSPVTSGKPQPENNNEYTAELFKQMENVGSDKTAYVTTDTGHIQAVQQDDGSWVVVKIQNNWPEFAADFGVKSISYEFIRALYNSEYPIKQAGTTINGPEGKYYRAFLGSNQAMELTEEDWKIGPSNFYKWLKSVSTSISEQDRSNRTIIEENI